MKHTTNRRDAANPGSAATAARPPGQIVLVLQGGGALGAYQAGVYQALHEAGLEPDWVIGTSIGAITAALIAGNPFADRVQRLRDFWESLEWREPFGPSGLSAHWVNPWANLETITRGLEGFFKPNPIAWLGVHTSVGIERSAFYCTAPLRETLSTLVDFKHLARREVRLTVGAVNARNGAMRYFDSREEVITADHVMASGALPPAFPAVRIAGEPYWDGGIYSNTPIEAVLDDYPRRSSTIFNVHLWNPNGAEPESIWQVLGRQKEIQYASRAVSHIERQRELHKLRHIISELKQHVPARTRESAAVKELASWGCRTTMHVVRLLAPRLHCEDHTKDIDFTQSGIRTRWDAGYADTQEVIQTAPWMHAADPIEGVIMHDHASTKPM